jgi:hypothetical protein
MVACAVKRAFSAVIADANVPASLRADGAVSEPP